MKGGLGVMCFWGFFFVKNYVSKIEGLDLMSRLDLGEINQSWHGIGLDALAKITTCLREKLDF